MWSVGFTTYKVGKFPSPRGAWVLVTKGILEDTLALLRFPSPRGAWVLVTRQPEGERNGREQQVSVPSRGLGLSDWETDGESAYRAGEFPSPRGAWVLVTCADAQASSALSVSFRPLAGLGS